MYKVPKVFCVRLIGVPDIFFIVQTTFGQITVSPFYDGVCGSA
jgi:hypothetical protein